MMDKEKLSLISTVSVVVAFLVFFMAFPKIVAIPPLLVLFISYFLTVTSEMTMASLASEIFDILREVFFSKEGIPVYLFLIAIGFHWAKYHKVSIVLSISSIIFSVALGINAPLEQAREEAIKKERHEQLKIYYQDVDEMRIIQKDVEAFREKNGSYSGYQPPDDIVKVDDECTSEIYIDVAPDGSAYVIHRPICSDIEKSYCIENGSEVMTRTPTAIIKEKYHCEQSYPSTL